MNNKNKKFNSLYPHITKCKKNILLYKQELYLKNRHKNVVQIGNVEQIIRKNVVAQNEIVAQNKDKKIVQR